MGLSPEQQTSSKRRNGKSASAFRTISEVSKELGLPQHVLRFWESKFPQIKPMKRGGGRRYYRPEDLKLLTRVRDLLYNDGYTIKGVQKLLREGGGKIGPPAAKQAEEASPSPPRDSRDADRDMAELKSIMAELEDIRTLLRPEG